MRCILLVICASTRASRLWADDVKRVMEDDGSETIVVFSMVVVNRSKRYIVAVWGDDFAFTVASEMLPHFTELLERNFECRPHREHRSRHAAASGEALDPTAGLD